MSAGDVVSVAGGGVESSARTSGVKTKSRSAHAKSAANAEANCLNRVVDVISLYGDSSDDNK